MHYFVTTFCFEESVLWYKLTLEHKLMTEYKLCCILITSTPFDMELFLSYYSLEIL